MDYFTFLAPMIIGTAILLGFMAKSNQKLLVPSIICLIVALSFSLFRDFSIGKIDINQTYVKVAIAVGALNQIFMIVKPVNGSLKDKLSYNFLLPWFTGFLVGYGIYLYPKDQIIALVLILFAVGTELILLKRKQ